MDSTSVKEFIRNEVPDWDDEVTATARFKAFSGQRSDWDPKFHFWRDLIIKICRHFGLLIIKPSQVKNDWFNRGGLSPLCIDHVLFVMYNEGDVMRIDDLVDPVSGRLSQLLKKVRSLMTRSNLTPEAILEHRAIITPLLKEKADQIVKVLSESHWTTSCVITMKKFQSMCGGSDEASATLSYLSESGKAQFLSINKKELIEGVKVSLSPSAVSRISSLDRDVLHLIWTTERLHQQLNVIDQRYETSKKSALAFLKSGDKKIALRHAKELKQATQSREKCSSLLNRVEEVLNIIADAESNKKVAEAIQIGARAMKENKISVEEVEVCLEELEESIDMHKQVEKTLADTESSLNQDMDDEEIEEEFMKLELELQRENSQVQTRKEESEGKTVDFDSAESLSNNFSILKLGDDSVRKPTSQDATAPAGNKSKSPALEGA